MNKTIDLTINKEGLAHNIQKAKENNIIIPTIAQMQNPDLIPEKIKEKLSHLYHNADIPFPGNGDIIAFVGSRYYLYEIILYFTEQFELIMRAIGNPSSDSVMDDIIHYIEHNYMDNIKLENIAPLFGYNSSYLGKIFNKKVGEGFNVFIDKVRINHSKDLLINTELKVYEIAEKVGYRNVDYFHTKFKKYVKESPAEFRKKNK